MAALQYMLRLTSDLPTQLDAVVMRFGASPRTGDRCLGFISRHTIAVACPAFSLVKRNSKHVPQIAPTMREPVEGGMRGVVIRPKAMSRGVVEMAVEHNSVSVD